MVSMFRGIFMQKFKQRGVSLITGVLVTICMLYLAGEMAVYTMGDNVAATQDGQVCIVLDAGHGGTWYRPKKFDS